LGAWGGVRRRLTRVQRLAVYGLLSDPREPLKLTALTALRRLRLDDAGCDDAVAAALTRNLTRLTFLRVVSTSMHVGLLPGGTRGTELLQLVGAHLTGLRQLCLSGARVAVVRDAQLPALSRLTRLTSLVLSPNSCSDAGTQALLAGMRGLAEMPHSMTVCPGGTCVSWGHLCVLGAPVCPGGTCVSWRGSFVGQSRAVLP
jgi:hypothetical protein